MQALVKDSPGKPAVRQVERKKPSNINLPDGVDPKLWRRVFISTYMQYVATTPNPWEVPVKLGCETMQVIWNVIFPNIPYTVTSAGSVYLIVRISYISLINSTNNSICRLFSESLIPTEVPLAPRPLQLSLPISTLKLNSRTPMKIARNSPSMRLIIFGSCTGRQMVKINLYVLLVALSSSYIFNTVLDTEIPWPLSRRICGANIRRTFHCN